MKLIVIASRYSDYNEPSKRKTLKFHNKLDKHEEMHIINSSFLLHLSHPPQLQPVQSTITITLLKRMISRFSL
jgi:hypothetical protein